MPTVLSIQSHVAYGHAGNAAAVFPLQRLGVKVWVVNTVQFSNHTGYKTWRGQVFAPEHIAEVIQGIADRGVLAQCDAVLSGYMGDATLGEVVVDTVAQVRAANAKARYICDPVMGDADRGFFVRDAIPPFMRDYAVPVADVITPNQFELEFLTDCRITTLADATKAAACARAMGPSMVLITSLKRAEAFPRQIEMMLDTADGTWLVSTPEIGIDPAPNGAGDCVAALLTAALLDGALPAEALSRAASGIYAVFEATHAAGTRELQLVAAQEQLVAPRQRFAAERLR